jgi:hypothetical protein
MPSTTSSTPSSIAGGYVKGEDQRNEASSSPPSEESDKFPTVTPPASWFFGRGGKNDSNQAGEQQARSKSNSQRDDSSSPSTTESKDHSSTEAKDSNETVNHHNSNTDPGMVSDNDEEDDYEGFNFVAISNSLLMAGRSFEHVPENKNESPKENVDTRSRASSDKHRGVLIMDGVDILCDSSEEKARAPVVGSNNNNDASVLTIPGSDSLPSDIGTLSHHDEDEDDEDRSDPLFDEGSHPSGDGASEQGSQDQQDALEDPYFQNYPPLFHRFLKNVQRTRRLRLVSDASDEVQSSGVSVVRNEDEEISLAWTVDARENDRFFRGPFKSFWRGRFFHAVLVVVLLTTAFACRSFVVSQRKQREAWEQRLQREEEATARLLAEKESLRQEMEILMEEAAVSAARAESLAREQERLLLQRDEAEKAEKQRIRLLQEQEQKKQQERQNQKRRREQPWRSDSNDDDEGFNEECSRRKDESASITIVDNCWFKAKADVNLGSCGGETKDYFTGIWNGLWEDWDYYFDEPSQSNAVEAYPKDDSQEEEKRSWKELKDSENDHYRIGSENNQQDREGDYDDQGRHYQYQDDTYYPPQDPLQDLFSVIHSAGQSFVNKLSDLISDEVEASQNAAREMEETAWQKYAEASLTVADAMEVAKEDMRELSKEALLAFRTAVQKSSSKNYQKKNSDETSHDSPPDGKEGANPVTRKGLFDAATALTSLSKSWQEYAKSLSEAGEGTEQ